MGSDDQEPKGPIDDEMVLSNGIDFETGAPLLPPLSLETLAQVAQGEILDADHLAQLAERHALDNLESLGMVGVDDPSHLGEAGWGVIYPRDLADAKLAEIRQALEPLLTLRQGQAGDLFREFSAKDSPGPKETGIQFAARHGQGPAAVDPEIMPFYLLLVGSPDQIPFAFGYQLANQFAVGRIDFDTVEEYGFYAQSVATAEKGGFVRPRRLTCFGVEHDRATDLSAKELIAPLVKSVKRQNRDGDWEIRTLIGEQAKKQDLLKTLKGKESPALLLTASHGMGFRREHPLQRDTQGALICQDHPTGGLPRPAKPEHYFAAVDVEQDEDLEVAGLVAFFFACYGAGTPRSGDFAHAAVKPEGAAAEAAFIARLPQRLLAKAKVGEAGKTGAGALAVIGQVERAWASSFHWSRVGSAITHFREAFRLLLKGNRIGWAMQQFSARYTALAAHMNDVRSPGFGEELDQAELARLWTQVNDARSYAIIGDPAVRLAVAETPA